MKYQITLQFETEDSNYELTDDELIDLKIDLINCIKTGNLNRNKSSWFYPETLKKDMDVSPPKKIVE